MPPVPVFSIRGNTVRVLRRCPHLQAAAQGALQAEPVIRVDKLAEQLRHGIILWIGAQNAAKAGAGIDDPHRLPHFQKRHAAVHLLEQPHERNRVDEMKIFLALLRQVAAPIQAECVLPALFCTVKRQIRRLIQPFKMLVFRSG